jgi:hypothetical protein
MQSLENTQGLWNKREQNARELEGRQPRGRDQGAGYGYRERPRDARQVRYGYRQNNPEAQFRQNTPVRQRNYPTDRGNTRQTSELNPHRPEFQPRDREEGRRSEQVGVHTERSTGINSSQGN